MKTYNVTFVANRFAITTTIEATDEEHAEEVARQTIIDEALLDVYKCGAKLAEVEEL